MKYQHNNVIEKLMYVYTSKFLTTFFLLFIWMV